jgi:hypothetical protein
MPSPQNHHASSIGWIIAGALAVWLALVCYLGATNQFIRPMGTPPVPILLGVVVPILLFLAAYRLWPAFREFILAADPRFLIALQSWRFAGLGFLALHAYGILPGSFAWPAGLGDIAIGVTAPFVMLALHRRPEFASSWLFATWNLLGILDLVVAVGTGASASAFATGAPGEVNTSPMALMPLVLIPAFFVPLFVMAHLAVLFQAAHATVPEPGPIAAPSPAIS